MAKEVALIQVELIAEQIGGAGEIAILSATANATNQNEWIKFMEEELASNPDYADIELVAKVYGDDDDTKSFQEAQGLMQAYPNLKGIISPTTVGIAATGRYLSESEYKGKVALTGLGLPNEMRPFVKDGTVNEFALWDPAQLGYVAAFAGKALADGDITGEVGDTFEAGDLGERDDRRGRHRHRRPAHRVQRRQHRRLRLLVAEPGRMPRAAAAASAPLFRHPPVRRFGVPPHRPPAAAHAAELPNPWTDPPSSRRSDDP